jgi:hypothetical protein
VHWLGAKQTDKANKQSKGQVYLSKQGLGCFGLSVRCQANKLSKQAKVRCLKMSTFGIHRLGQLVVRT